MEASHSCLTTGEQSGGQEHRRSESPQRKSPPQHHQQQQTVPQKPHDTAQQTKPLKRQQPERKRLRHQQQSVDSDAAPEGKNVETAKATKATRAPSLPAGGQTPMPPKPETQEGTPKQKRERKPQRPGKYVCTYCGRACAKPSVLQKHIRSHTGERPYPCDPCGFSFKTKSNLYKHRKSHTHRVKAGLALGEPRSLEEQVTESEDETRQLSSVSSGTERQGHPDAKSDDADRPKDCSEGMNDSYAVKKRLAMRLSRGKHGPLEASDEKPSSVVLGSRGSTESGYFSRSESTEQSQDSPPNTSAKSYAEIILGKYGRLGQLQRMSRHQNQQSSGQEDKSIPFTVPKKQVIDHITKLITINEAVVDTSKIDSVKPRRFSLSRKSSAESLKGASVKETLINSPKAGDLGYKNSGSITMGVPCEKFHHQTVHATQPASQTPTAPLLRSHSLPSAASSLTELQPGASPSKFRTSQSFDERPPGSQASRRYGMLRRQPAIEIPLGAEPPKEEHKSSHSFYPDSLTTVPDHKQSQPQPYECEVCGTGCKDWEGYKTHKQGLCSAHHPINASEVVISQMECSQLINQPVRTGASAMRKRRKEESFEFDDPSPAPSPSVFSSQCRDEGGVAYESPKRPTLQTCSVIQHTSSFEKQEVLPADKQGRETAKSSPPHEECQPEQHQAKLPTRKLVRQHNVQVPEILVTEDSNMSVETVTESSLAGRLPEKPDDFQWPQRSPSLAQLPIEKLPPKKKRLRLAEVAQSSGDSSFDSISMPHSPSQDSSASFASSRSTSFEESNRPDMDISPSITPLRRSRAPHMLTVPGVHQHREMRRSASEQAPHDPQQGILMAETRSKSFDYSSLSPERSAVGWRERRKCLLFRHSAVKDPEEEEEAAPPNTPSNIPEPLTCNPSSQASPGSVHGKVLPSSPESSNTISQTPTSSQYKETFCQWKLSQNIQLKGRTEAPISHGLSMEPLVKEVPQVHTGQPPGVSVQLPQPHPTPGPSGAARAHYLPIATGLKLRIPLEHDDLSCVPIASPRVEHPPPNITSSLEILQPAASPAVAVRLQTVTLTPACAIYTTLSQSSSATPQEAVDAVIPTGVRTDGYGIRTGIGPTHQEWSDDDGQRLPGSGGSKRMLSPSNSIELLPESQQQQKRVKEEEEREAGRAEEKLEPQILKPESRLCVLSVCSAITRVSSSFPSLLSNTCNSWCYLNYTKPNPSALDEQKPSVYSSWSTSGHDPNPPGLTSKIALSLLHCRQRASPSIYTMSSMSVETSLSEEHGENQRARSTQVYTSQSYSGVGTRKEPQPAEDSKSFKGDDAGDGNKEEEAQPWKWSGNTQSAELWIPERRADEELGSHAGRGGAQSERAGGSPAVLEPRAQPSTDTGHCDHTHAGLALKAKGNTQKHATQEALGSGSCGPPEKTGEGVGGDLSPPAERRERQYSDPGKRGDAEDRSVGEEDGGKNDGDRVSPPAGRNASQPHPSQDAAQRSSAASASTRRALFARPRLEPAASAPSSGSPSPGARPLTPKKHPTPPHTPSPPPSLPPSSSPVRPASPGGVPAPRCGSPLSPGSTPGDFSQPQNYPKTRERPVTARLFVDEAGPTCVTPHPSRTRAAHGILSHLPLHSQQPCRAPSLLIPIGGIHMIQPRSYLPFYSLVSSPQGPAGPEPGEGWRPGGLSSPPKGMLLLKHQEAERRDGTGPSDRAAAGEASGSSPAAGLQREEGLREGRFRIRELPRPGTDARWSQTESKSSTLYTEAADAHTVTHRCVYPGNSPGQKTPSSHTQL